MKSFATVLATLALQALAATPARAEPLFGADELQRNGVVSRHLWTPDFATAEAGGMRFSAGVALGLRGSLQANLGRRATPMLTMQIDRRSSLSLLPAGSSGAMLVLQTAP